MEGKDKFDELLVSYLLNELNAEEDALVIEWLAADEQNKIYLEELKQTLDLIQIGQAADKINLEAEWDRLNRAKQGDVLKPVFVNDAERFGNEVIKEVGLNRKTGIYKTIALTAVAACVVLAIGLGWSLLTRQKPLPQTVARTIEERTVVPAAIMRNLVNNSGQTKRYELEDGTMVMLFDKSEMHFSEPFDADKRHIHLQGRAEFQVAKNELKPFTVFSGDISVTALGTRFTVTAFEDSKDIFVRLFEGKVVIKSTVPGGIHKRDYFLFPGQELIYNRPKETTRVWTFIHSPTTPQSAPQSDRESKSLTDADDPSIPKYGRSSWYMFNNQPLEQVFDQLADMYNVEIQYCKKDISKMYFIGTTFEKSDSLETVLRQITSLNKLNLARENKKYIITKK
jgi:transmembrane sensor